MEIIYLFIQIILSMESIHKTLYIMILIIMIIIMIVIIIMIIIIIILIIIMKIIILNTSIIKSLKEKHHYLQVN